MKISKTQFYDKFKQLIIFSLSAWSENIFTLGSQYYFVSRRQPQPPALPRRILGAEAGRCCMWRLRTARPPWSSSWSLRGHGRRGHRTRAVAPEGFSGRFASGSDEVTEGVRTLAADFRSLLWDVEWYSYLLFKDPLLWWDWPLEIRVKEMRWNE